jgi:hypothetical protein
MLHFRQSTLAQLWLQLSAPFLLRQPVMKTDQCGEGA